MSKVLVVDDDRAFCDVLRKVFEEMGHAAVVVFDGVEALERTEGEGFDLIVSDWKMPRMSGTELCETLKERKTTQDIPVILIGASSIDHWETEAYNAGAIDYLTKPVNLADLQVRISKALAE